MDDIGNLHLSDDKEEVLSFSAPSTQERRADLELCLAGRFLTQKPIRSQIMKERKATIWQPGRGVAIKEIGRGLFVFQFFHKIDVQNVLNKGTWSFDGHMLLLSKMGRGVLLAQVPLFHAIFWVQVQDLPIEFMCLEVGKGLGNFIGEFLDYEPKNTSDFWRTFMRIQVRVDVRKPLKKGKKIKRADGDVKAVKFKYERSTLFYYLCGLLGHGDNTCEKLFLMEEDNGERGWGPELKVECRKPGGSGGGCRWLQEDGVAATEMRNPSPVRGNGNATSALDLRSNYEKNLMQIPFWDPSNIQCDTGTSRSGFYAPKNHADTQVMIFKSNPAFDLEDTDVEDALIGKRHKGGSGRYCVWPYKRFDSKV